MTRNYIAAILLAPALLLTACSGDSEIGAADIPATNANAATTAGASVQEPAKALCLTHGAAADRCFICDPGLRDPARLWCHEHGRYEDRCFVCHPEIRDKARLYCEEHGVYEDECFICHPSAVHSPENGDGHGASQGLFCNEHNVAEVECGICQPLLANDLKPGEGLKIRLPSLSSESKVGIVAQPAQPGPVSSNVHAVGELRFNQNRLVHITPLTDGVVRRVHVDLGQRIERGQVLAELASPEIAEVKAALLTGVAEEKVSAEALARAQELFNNEMTSARELYDAEAQHTTASANLRAAEQRLFDLGFDQKALERIVAEQEAKSVLPLAAPFAGTVIARDAVVGDVVAMGDRVFSIADLSTLWLILAVSEADVARLRVGQSIDVRSQTIDRTIMGELTWISSQLNETTRMAEVRAEVANPDGSLRAGMFVDATITVGEQPQLLLLPRDTVHRFAGNAFVFVRLEGDLYELRRVDTMPATDGLTAVTAGLANNDMVVVEQSYLLKSEFQKSRLGAGCAD